MKVTDLISNKSYNYPFAVVLWIILFFTLQLVAFLVGFPEIIWTVSILVITGAAVFTDNEQIEVMTHKQILMFGQETGIWVGPGFYFKLFIFTFAKGEDVHEEKKDVQVKQIQCQDKKGKVLLAEANGDWVVADEDVYKNFDAKRMEGNLTTLIHRTMIRACGKLPYRKSGQNSNDASQILGEQLGPKILEDPYFEEECKKFGIKFTNLIADAIAADLKQENINTYREELFENEKAKYGNRHLSKEDIRKINQDVDVALDRAKRIISNAPILPRVDV